MDSTAAAILRCWSCSPWVVGSLLISGVVYFTGWRRLRSRGTKKFGHWQLVSFVAALVACYLALQSPLDALAPWLLTAHMAQHLLLMFVVPPLVWLAAPELPCLAGLPAAVRRDWVVPLLQLGWLRRGLAWCVQPVQAWTAAAVLMWLWHVPALYELALRNPVVHDVEHVSFLASSLLFWWPVLAPYPRRRTFSAWLLLPYLLLATVQGGLLAAVLTFSDRVIYPHYAAVPRLGGISASHDQAIAGAMMWVVGIVATLLPLAWLGKRLFSGELDRHLNRAAVPMPDDHVSPQSALTLLPILSPQAKDCQSGCCNSRGEPTMARGIDLLRISVLGRLLRAPHTRTVLQTVFLIAALLVMLDGLLGPQLAPLNLATVMPWIHWRAAVVLGLVLCGNLFCFACPFTLPRRLAKNWLPARWRWPGWLRSKWPAVFLLVTFFWAYELFRLWDSPWWTAWLVGGYFLAALAIDGLFHGTPFCKYVCPIGQFNFVYSLVSPAEVTVRSSVVCSDCESLACLHGRSGLAGCEMDLLQPWKQGNLDCTFCLDCVRSCPHDNVALQFALPLRVAPEVTAGPWRKHAAGWPALIVVLTAAAFLNAAWMTAPLATWQHQAETAGGAAGRWLSVSGGTLLGLIVIPAAAISLAAWLSRAAGKRSESWRSNARQYCVALVPLGCAMWGAHYAFHSLTGTGAALGAGSRFLADLGLCERLAMPWTCACCSGAGEMWLLKVQCLLIDAGLLSSLYWAYCSARKTQATRLAALRVSTPWMLLTVGLFLLGVLILSEPMQMRGAVTTIAGGAG